MWSDNIVLDGFVLGPIEGLNYHLYQISGYPGQYKKCTCANAGKDKIEESWVLVLK